MKTRPLFCRTHYWPVLTLLGILLFYSAYIHAQCFNTVQFPAEEIPVSTFAGDVTMISESSEAGHFCVIKDLIVGISYTFTSSNPDDFITIRIEGGTSADPPVSSGPSPHTFSATSHILEVHINLTSPPCGTENVSRTTTITCLDGFPEPPKTGINTTDPAATLDVVGRLKISDDNTSPEAGMIRFNSNTMDFEGYNGEKWLSLTRSASTWGNLPADVGVQDAKLNANDGAASDQFGISSAISGDYAVIGANLHDVGANSAQGAAYIFVRSGTVWTQQAKLTANDGAGGDQFGSSVAINGDYAIIGASRDDVGANENQGSTYIFVRSGTTWSQQAKLTANDSEAEDQFGRSVAISDDYAIIGANLDDVGANTTQGSAYVFVRSGTSWTQQAKLTANDGAAGDEFGFSISISGYNAIIGAHKHDVGSNTDQGSAYIFTRSGSSWTQQAKLIANDGAAEDYYGISVAISGNYAVIGALFDNVGINTRQGSAYVYVKSSTISNLWTKQAKLTANDGEAEDQFGRSVAISGDNTIIGAEFNDVGANSDQGAAYIFVRSGNTWTQQAKLTANDGAVDDRLGRSVAISGDDVVIGAWGGDVGANTDQGAAYFFCKKQ